MNEKTCFCWIKDNFNEIMIEVKEKIFNEDKKSEEFIAIIGLIHVIISILRVEMLNLYF